MALRDDVAATWYWHSIDLGDGLVTQGHKGPLALMESELAGMRLPDLRGLSVLDVGTWDGFFAFACERLGAERVVALDHFVWEAQVPPGVVPDVDERGTVVPTWPAGPLPGRRGFDLAHAALGSRVQPLHLDFAGGNLARLGIFDVVLFLGVLYHLENPLEALRRLRAHTGRLAIIESEAVEWPGHEAAGLLEYFPGAELHDDPTNAFVPTASALLALCRQAGFRRAEVVRGCSPYHSRGPDGAIRYRLVVHAWP